MMFSDHIKIGLASVKKSRFRSMITILGIVIGVVSVVTIVTLGEGIKKQVNNQSAELANGAITIRPGKLVNRDSTGKITSLNLLASTASASVTPQDVETISKNPEISGVTSFATISALPTYDKKVFNDGLVVAYSGKLSDVIDHKVEFGNYPNADDSGSGRYVVIGAGVAQKLFNETVPIGKSLTVKNQQYVVGGIYSPFRDTPLASGINYNNIIYVPESGAAPLKDIKMPYFQVIAKLKNPAKIDTVAKQVTESIKQNHSGLEDFSVLKQDEAGVISGELIDTLSRMILGMAAITLIVSGIGIMNVMLVSVTERTREIGIRKAIGATNRQITNQFMIEALILSVWGALLGVIVSILLHLAIRIFTNLEPVLSWQPIVVAGLMSVVVGVVFGVIPATKAARKDPIESLRSSN